MTPLTIGRKVLYWAFGKTPTEQPLSASIAYVHNDRMCNLGVWSRNGEPFGVVGVQFCQPEDPQPEYLASFAEWVPFQIGQQEAKSAPIGGKL